MYRTGTSAGEAFAALLFVGLMIAAVIGWVMNIVKLFGSMGEEATALGETLIRLAGIPIPFIGAVAGYF